jgi:signal transduction histidine kinase/ligand-binding sensor domain-containing protein
MKAILRICLGAWALAAATHPAIVARADGVDNLLSGYSLTSWTDGDGVPLGTVYAIGQDRDGYLWIGTDAGLLRFDGVRFTAWDGAGEGTLPKSPASALCIARDGTLWVGFSNGGVRRIRGGRAVDERQPRGALGSVTDLVEDGNGTVWAISDGRLFRTHEDAWEKTTVIWNDREPTVLHLFVSRAGDLWVATAQGGVFRRARNAQTFEQMAAGFTWGIGEDAGGGIWTTDIVAGFRRLGERNPPRHSFEGSGYRLLHDRRGNLWAATLGGGLWRAGIDGAARPGVERTAMRNGLSSDSVQSLLEDRDGNIWVGTTGGLHRLTERALTPIENVGFVVDVTTAASGEALAGTTNGLVTFTRPPEQWHRSRNASGGPDVRTLFRDRDGTIWIGTNNGVWRFANKAFTAVQLPHPPETPITVITAASDGGVWLLYNNWLQRWDGRNLAPLVLPHGTDVQRIALAHSDSVGRLWIAYDQGKIGFVDRAGGWHALGPAEGIPAGTHSVIYTFLEDGDSVIWIGGNGGLTRIANGRAITLTSEDGLPGSRVWSIVHDNDGDFWLSVDRGLLRVSREALDDAVADRTRPLQYKLYDTLDGLAGAPLGNIRSARGADGRLWFVRGGGLTEVDPRRLGRPTASTIVPVRIEAATANEQRLAPDPMTSLPAGTRRLQISYSAVTVTSNKLRFRYRLDGFDTDWVNAGTRRQAFYTNLSPGNYRFRVEANSEDGAWTTAGTAWDFAIQPAFYQTTWFYALSIAGIALLLTLAWQIRLGLVRREFSLVLAERARLSREIHDTLLQSLVGVALQFDAIANSIDRSSSAARDQLLRVRRQVEAYIREARQSIWDLRSPVLETHDLSSALRDFGKRAAAGTAIRFTAAVTGTPRQCSAKLENQLLRIGQEAITNAVRHAHANRITLEMRFDDHAVTLRVSDDGRGFEYMHPPHDDTHYGLMTMRERAEELGGRFTIATAAGRGTTVETVVPVAAP